MRITLTLSIIFCATLTALSQTFNYFENNPMWKQSSSCGSDHPCIVKDDFVYYLKGDSTIDNFTYKKVFKRGVFSHQWYDEGPAPESCKDRYTFNQFHALVRQEDQKVYLWDINQPKDRMIYNFGLKLGDTLPQTLIQNQTNLVVSNIDSILVETEYRKRFHVNNSNFLIEGIGNSRGFLEHFESMCERLQCYSINEKTYFTAEGELPCNWTVSTSPITYQKRLKPFPNPAQNELFLENFKETQSIKELTLITVDGKQKTPQFISDQNKVTIKLTDLKPGIYFLEISTIDGKRFYSKFTKE